MRMNENGNEKCSLLPFVARFGFWCVFPFAVHCLLLLFVALSCQFYLKNQNRQMPFVARYAFLLLVLVFSGCFNLSIALLVVAFRWYEKPKQATKGKKSPNGNQALMQLLFFHSNWNQGDSFFHTTEQLQLVLRNDHLNKTGHNSKTS